MIDIQKVKRVPVLNPQSIEAKAATDTTTAEIDTKGYKRSTWNVFLGAVGGAVTAMKIQEADTTVSSDFVDITGLISATSLVPNSTATSVSPTSGDAGTIWGFDVSLLGNRQRYQRMVITHGGTSDDANLYAVWADLSRGEANTSTTGDNGYAQVLRA